MPFHHQWCIVYSDDDENWQIFNGQYENYDENLSDEDDDNKNSIYAHGDSTGKWPNILIDILSSITHSVNLCCHNPCVFYVRNDKRIG